MEKYTWKNLVAFTVWKCKLCGAEKSRDSIATHLHQEHQIQGVVLFKDAAYSENFEYPNVIQGAE